MTPERIKEIQESSLVWELRETEVWELLDALEKLTAERDRWKTLAEALKQAAKGYGPCYTCIRETPNSMETCGSCKYWHEKGEFDDWEFDETRFTAKEANA